MNSQVSMPPIAPLLARRALGGADVFAVCPFASQATRMRAMHGPAGFLDLCITGRWVYLSEALVHYALREPFLPRDVAAELFRAEAGIHPAHPLFALRERVAERVERLGHASQADILILWGAHARIGRLLATEAGVILRDSAVRTDIDATLGAPDVEGTAALLAEWARASRVDHHRVLSALDAMVYDVLLNEIPEPAFRPLTHDALALARSVASDDPLLAFLLFRCLQRVAACAKGILVRWRSKWLEGSRKSNHAIPGASGRKTEIRRLLMDHVLERCAGHSAGYRSATYRVRVELTEGAVDARAAAEHLGLELTENEVPRRRRRR